MEENLGNSEAINQLETTEEEIAEGTSWECSVCTYKNNSEAFKCLMCDVRKGTSTRKPRLNQQIVAQQVAQQFSPAAVHGKKPGSKKASRKFRPRLKNVDRNSAQEIAVTVGNVTVIITDYKLLQSEDGRIFSESLLSNSASDDSLEGSAIIYPDVNQKGQVGSIET